MVLFAFLGGVFMGMAHLALKRICADLPETWSLYSLIVAVVWSPLSYGFLALSLSGTLLYTISLRATALSVAAVVFLSTIVVTILLLDAVVNRTALGLPSLLGAGFCLAGMVLISAR